MASTLNHTTSIKLLIKHGSLSLGPYEQPFCFMNTGIAEHRRNLISTPQVSQGVLCKSIGAIAQIALPFKTGCK